MRNELLHAYSLHQRPYQDKRTIYYLLTFEHGIVHGIAGKGAPQFVPLTLFATGKKSLKIFQQLNIADSVPLLVGQQQYAALYINELTLKLLPIEDAVPKIYSHYEAVISKLQQPLDGLNLRLLLRHYENILFNELGFSIDLTQDSEQNPIDPNQWYRFIANAGWIPEGSNTRQVKKTIGSYKHSQSKSLQVEPIIGNDIVAMREGIRAHTLKNWSVVHRQLVDYLFDYKPLQSRILWQQFQRYQ